MVKLQSIFLITSLLFNQVAMELNYTAIMTDEWTYANTMTQSVVGILGFITMFGAFFGNWFFYHKIQKDMIKEFQKRIDSINGNETHGNNIDNKNQYDQQELVNTDRQLIERIKYLLERRRVEVVIDD
jgi:hypothetical protein